MDSREKIETALAQARAARDKASVDRARAGAEWRKQAAASVNYDKTRAEWTRADTEWNKADAEMEKLGAALAELNRGEEVATKRAALEASLASATIARE